jgi:hypothetical protein|tara:strand:+ start:167 stop:553 length:387 start_codon:yes stop_codon:yes gene_type:complete
MTAKEKLSIAITWTIILIWAASWDAYGGGKIYSPPNDSKKIYGQKKNLTKQQKINQGIDIKPKMTLCRLKKRVKTKSGEEVCIYEGGNKTFEMAIENRCPRSYMCEYNPHGEPPNIDSVIDSLNDAVK